MSAPQQPHALPARVRRAEIGDMIGVARVYLAAFPDSVEQLALHTVREQAIADVLSICLAAEPEGFGVAEVDELLVGYCICVARTERLWSVALQPGRLGRMAGRWLTGGYGIGLTALVRILADQLRLRRTGWGVREPCHAQVISIAVHPQFQGLGLGRALLQRGLDYLRTQGSPCVRLNVRPGNWAAKRLYESFGFVEAGQVSDARGSWEVMMLRWAAGAS